jgi:type VI protein secretion system component Hcp
LTVKIIVPGMLALFCLVLPQPARASAITLEIAYPGISPTAENEISTLTFNGTSASFEHYISNISPQLLQLTATGTHLSSLTVTAFAGGVSLGDLVFNDVIFTSLTHPGGGITEDVSFVFAPPGGFYTIGYPGIPPTAENQISTMTLDQTGVSFTHPISNLSPQLLQFVATGTHFSNVTFTPENAAGGFGSLVLTDALFSSLTHSGLFNPVESVSVAFNQLAIEPAGGGGTGTTPVPEPGSWLFVMSAVVLLAVRKRFLAA